jgi:hypothetical protein
VTAGRWTRADSRVVLHASLMRIPSGGRRLCMGRLTASGGCTQHTISGGCMVTTCCSARRRENVVEAHSGQMEDGARKQALALDGSRRGAWTSRHTVPDPVQDSGPSYPSQSQTRATRPSQDHCSLRMLVLITKSRTSRARGVPLRANLPFQTALRWLSRLSHRPTADSSSVVRSPW